MKKLLIPLAALLALPATAHAAPPNPFGHPCTAQNGVLFCPASTDLQRVPSFDGVPLDVDVTLPATGNGPFPAIVMMHGWGGGKTNFESNAPEPAGSAAYNNVAYAQRGYAVITYSARGFGRSCGQADSRTSPACDRGWIHLSDQRYESRDTQYLLGLLADQGVVQPAKIGVTGISYGGIQSQNLARLRNRVRMPDGSLQPWRSPAGKPMSIAAAWARWGTSDLTYSLTPNGRFLDFRNPPANLSRRPLGVEKRSYVLGLYALGVTAGFVAPQGADPGADLTGWNAITDRGEPYTPEAEAVATELSSFHSAGGIAGPTAPMIVQNGWTDDLFPVTEALRVYRTYRRMPGARVSYQFGDLGHARGSNKPNADALFNRQGAAFFDAYLKGTGKAPANNSVTAFTQTCPVAASAGGPYRASTWERLHPGAFPFGRAKTQTVTSSGGNTATLNAFDPLAADACKTVRRERARGTAVYERFIAKPFTMLGLPTLSASIRTKGRGGMIAARLWDVSGGQQRLVSRGLYRLRDNQKGKLLFQLFGNGYRFKRGHVVKLELIGRDPAYLRPSNFKFRVRVSKLVVELPTRERPSRRRGISRPRLGR
ncbi:MAG TPA: alpha/beta fold hydrolase [Thermoleophilaceae bacterium]|jgi:pimeloyl-ACP methyl ester carboxylesterase